MSKRKRKSKNKIFQPDDKFFKEVMEHPINAIEYLKTYYPELAKDLDLSTFQIQREKLSIPNFQTFEADIVYSCRFKNSEEELNLSLLWENKSQPDEYIFIQIGLYLFLRYYKMVKSKDLNLEPIIPLIFYNGKKDWIPKTLNDLFQDHPFLKVFESFLPNFDFHFTNIGKIPLEELMQIEVAFFKSAMIAMANKHDYDLLLQQFPIIFDIENEDAQIALVLFIYSIHERLPEQVKKDVSPFVLKIQNVVMSTMERFKKAGKKEGKIEMAQTLYNEGFSIDRIAKLIKEDEDFVKRAIAKKSNQ